MMQKNSSITLYVSIEFEVPLAHDFLCMALRSLHWRSFAALALLLLAL